MKPGDLVRFKEGTLVFKRRGETYALITQVITIKGTNLKYIYLLMPTNEIQTRRIDDVEVVIEAG